MVKVGTCLIASPEIVNSLYSRSILLVCEHSEQGTIALVINKVLPIESDEEKVAVEKLKTHQIITLLGGPMHPDEAFMLHNNPMLEKESISLADGVFLGSLLPVDPKDTTHSMRLIFGYSGWVKGQLEKEIAKGLWIEVPTTQENVFALPLETQWNSLAKQLKGKHKALACFPSRLDLN